MNHSHMNALVEPSFTELMRPRMSLFTIQAGFKSALASQSPSEPQKTRRAGVECTLELELVRRPALLQRHHVRHSLASTVMPVKRSERQEGPGSRREGGDASRPAVARNPNGRSLQIRYRIVLGVLPSDDRPGSDHKGAGSAGRDRGHGCGAYYSPVERRRDIASDKLVRLRAFCDAGDERVRERTICITGG